MEKIILFIVELLFEKVPFSKKAEEAKFRIQKTLENEYIRKCTTEEHSMAVLENVIKQTHDIYEAGKLAGYSREDINSIVNTQEISDFKNLKKLIKKSKYYLIMESVLIMLFISSVINLICNFNLFNFIFRFAYASILAALYVFLHKKENVFKKKTNLFEIKCDETGKNYIQSMHDKYLKKEINMICLCCLMGAYIVFINLYSIFSLAYRIEDIIQQLSFYGFLISIAAFLTIKNVKCFKLFSGFFVDERNKKLKMYIKKILVFSAIYWMIAIIIILLLRNTFSYIYNIFMIVAIIYAIMLLIQNLTFRKPFVFKNLVVNPKRIVTVSLAVLLLISYQIMSADTWLTQSYINTVPALHRTPDDIEYDEENGIYTITTDKENFKILQLTDIHLGGSVFSISKDLKALKAVKKIIYTTKPDFVVVTGDLVFPTGIMSFSLNNRAPVMQFASFMRNTGIPWAFTYGNHDTEAMSVITDKQFDELMKTLSYRNSRNLLYPYIQPDIYGRNNQLIEIRHNDGKLMQALFLLDSNDYLEGGKINEYDYIHDDQVAWYEKQIQKLCQNEGYLIPSMVFFHMPLQEYKEAYELYESGNTDVKYFYGNIGEKMIDKICCSKYPSSLFDTAQRLGSTKAMFCGHDHYNNLSVEYKGIRLTYGYSIDYLAMPGIEDDTEQRGATLITIDRNGDYVIEPYRLMNIA